MLARWSIPRLFTLLGAIGVMLTLGAMALSARGAYVEALETKKTTLKELVDSGVSIAQSYVERARTGAMTVPEAQKAALAALGAARFDHDNYLFVETVSAMSGIEASSEQIGRIVGVIDEIAFQTLFQLPKSFGRARQVMLWTVKKCTASRNLRSSCPGSPRLDRAASNTSSTIVQSRSVIPVSMAGSLLPVTQ
jgi:hypothetical protein